MIAKVIIKVARFCLTVCNTAVPYSIDVSICNASEFQRDCMRREYIMAVRRQENNSISK